MNIKSRNKRSAEFSMSSMTDIVFLLLIFFMLTSTLVAPNALKLLLPSSNSQTLAPQTIEVSIDETFKFYVGAEEVNIDQLPSKIAAVAQKEGPETTIVLRSDKSVPIEQVVKVMNIANELKIKMILATKPE